MQQRREDVSRIEAALIEGAKDRGEDLLGLGAARGAVAATDLAGDDGRTNRVFGARVGGIDGGLAEEGEQSAGLGGQMRGEALDVRHGRARGRQHVEDLLEQPPAGDRQSVRRHVAGRGAVPEREGLLQARLDLARQRTPRMIAAPQPAPA